MDSSKISMFNKSGTYSSSKYDESSCDKSKYCDKSTSCDKTKYCDKTKHCDKSECENTCEVSKDLFSEYYNTVVRIHSEFILTNITDTTPVSSTLEPGVRADLVLDGNGFLTKDCDYYYIVAPAHLVLLPPSLTSVTNRFPLFDPTNLALTEMKDQMIRASRIFATVYDVNGTVHTYTYELDLVGVDGAGNVAVLKINYQKNWNKCLECLRCHPHLKFAKCNKVCNGECVYLIGDHYGNKFLNRSNSMSNGIIQGTISDRKHLEHSGWMVHDSIVVDATVHEKSTGMPILNCEGYVIGMQTTSLAGINLQTPISSMPELSRLSHQYVAGVSSRSMMSVFKILITGFSCGTNKCDYDDHLELICDPVGSYYRYKKGYLGLAYEVFDGICYDLVKDYTSGTDPTLNQPRVRLDSQNRFIDSPPSCKIVKGVKVIGLAGLNPEDLTGIENGYYYVPGGTGAPPLIALAPLSPLLNVVKPGDVIVEIDGCVLGDSTHQISPSLVTWRKCPGKSQVEIAYKRLSELSQVTNVVEGSCSTDLYSTKVCLQDYPKILDYPWYMICSFPLISDVISPYPGFAFPRTQLTNPQVPMLNVDGAGVFHPAV